MPIPSTPSSSSTAFSALQDSLVSLYPALQDIEMDILTQDAFSGASGHGLMARIRCSARVMFSGSMDQRPRNDVRPLSCSLHFNISLMPTKLTMRCLERSECVAHQIEGEIRGLCTIWNTRLFYLSTQQCRRPAELLVEMIPTLGTNLRRQQRTIEGAQQVISPARLTRSLY